MIPENHFLRVIEKYFDWNFIYEDVKDNIPMLVNQALIQ